MNACRKCGLKQSTEYCPKCGEIMRPILATTSEDIFVQALTEDNISNYGFHVVCGGIVEDKLTSSGKKVYCCKACFLRIIEDKNNPSSR